MNDDNFAFKVLDCTEQVLASKGDEEKKLASLMELDRMIDYTRPAVVDGISEEQARAYKSREENVRRKITEYAHTLPLESQTAAREQLLTRGPSYYNSSIMLSLPGAVPGTMQPQVSGPAASTKKGLLNRFFK